MRIDETKPPRAFNVGLQGEVTLHEVATIALEAEEMVTFLAEGGREYDVTRKTWGYYATPSLNGRLPEKGLRPVLVKNTLGRWFVLLVEETDKAQQDFQDYCGHESLKLVGWLDDEETLAKIEAAL